METSKVLLREGAGVNLTLTIVDTPGFGDAVDNSSCWEPVLHYVESQYEAFLEAETQVHWFAFDHLLTSAALISCQGGERPEHG